MSSGSDQPDRRGTGFAELVAFLTTDFLGITRGRSVPREAYDTGEVTSCGWVPANTGITPFDTIADGAPFDSRGDLRLVPDRTARFRTHPAGAATPIDVVMSDVVELDGSPWSCCPRAFLKQTLTDLLRETGLSVTATFEMEFSALGTNWPHAPVFSYQAMRRADPFGPAVMASLAAAGIEPEVFIPEYGVNQFEITHAPCPALVAADRTSVIREVIRELARLQGFRASFSPKTTLAGVGNGVHIHWSFRNEAGAPAMFDASRPGRLSEIGGQFAAGVVRHLPALVALTAPSPISCLRLKPHNWSASYTWLGERDREATIRICPTFAAGGKDPALQFNLEYRAADATASPHLSLGAIVRAGLQGIREKLPAPPVFDGDPADLTDAERATLGLHRLPASLEEGLQAFAADAVVSGWFDPVFRQAFTATKRMEAKQLQPMNLEAQCARYAEVY